MKIQEFLKNIENSCSKIAYFCVIHMFEKEFDIEKDSLDKEIIKEFLIDYNNYDKFLNDYAGVIYKKFESSNDEVYNEICKFLDVNPDNKYLFSHRLKRISNQNPMKYLNIEDEDLRKAAISRLEDKINTIESSLYYKENKEVAFKEIEKIKKSIDIVKIATGVR
ncbi:MAG: hypothetical protein ACNI28_00020 [Arcobacter sp.]|uniref:hypothetical protein n=1 Tax=Arcobacter sp. TaxID=1872629 RepID=UPI003B00A870